MFKIKENVENKPKTKLLELLTGSTYQISFICIFYTIATVRKMVI